MEGQRVEGSLPVLYRERDETMTPIGDFIAQVAAGIAAVFGFLTIYTNTAGQEVKGYESPFSIIIIVVSSLAWLFASYVLLAKLIRYEHHFVRSPGWIYAAAGALVIFLATLSVIFPKGGYEVNWGVPMVQFITGVFMSIGAMMKFD
ncbi:MAG: hypothetical protein JW854_07140 [Actinobacteria bacterium]|nr:hypothetical protein [Actinomycetota bacterium]